MTAAGSDLATITPTETLPTNGPDMALCIAQHLATTLSGRQLVHGGFVGVKATVAPGGSLVVDVTQDNFEGPDKTFRLLLNPTAPVEIDSPPVPDEISPETQAVLDTFSGDAA